MLRTESHIIEEESEKIFRKKIPKTWIVRKEYPDYGVDYSVEIVNDDIVSGNRFWMQLKGTKKIKFRIKKYRIPDSLQEELPGKYFHRKYVSYPLKTQLLEYALKCSFPLLIGIVDITNENIYWLPLKNWIVTRLEKENSNWRKQKTVSIRIPIENNFEQEIKSNYYGLRWFATEPSIKNALNIVGKYVHEINQKIRLTNYVIGEGFIDYGEEEELVLSIIYSLDILNKTLNIDALFGENTIDFFIILYKNRIMEGIKSCYKLLEDIPKGKISFIETSKDIFTIGTAIDSLSLMIAFYDETKEKFLMNDPFY